MSKNLLWSSHTSSSDEEPIPRAMQWFFLKLVSVWIFVAITLPIVAFCITKNPLCLSGLTTLTPPVYILYRITKYLFPLGEKEFQIVALKIQRTAGKNDTPNKESG